MSEHRMWVRPEDGLEKLSREELAEEVEALRRLVDELIGAPGIETARLAQPLQA